ncbi:protein WALLS ARE THIN 1-like isoform X2 [Lotus japonicus]|uniref:protein WALLS ARE THIN 1-like isoform X2 n=1 Tax=Lotus japonicus TaxID=34305 RepID=UPI00258DB27F|nr:protein WALLS ARE THIN 1-like isoform X2 [Lotus japonicus]
MVAERAKLHLALTFLQFCYAGNHIFVRIALDSGVSKLVFPVYRNITALLLLGPLAYFSEKKDRPSITRYCLVQFFLLGLVGITLKEGFYLLGLDNTSPTFAAAMQNSVPALTFLMAVVLRYESVHFNRMDGLAKVLGVLASVGGASIITLYKGPTIYTPNLALHQEQFLSVLRDVTAKNMNMGGIYLFGHCLCWSGWIVMQAFVLKNYSAPLTVSAFTCFFGIVQLITIAAFFEKDPKAWQLNFSEEIYSILYSGLVNSGLAAALQIWTIGKGGPVLASIYLPLQTLLVALMASIVFGEDFFLGGIIGAFLIITGLYLVVWGRSQETKSAKECMRVPIIESEKHPEEKSYTASLMQQLIPTQNV